MYDSKAIIRKWEIVGMVWIVIVGTLLHFIFKWSGESKIVALFSPVNESVWEHLKMGYFALVFFMLIEYWFLKEHTTGYFLAKTIGIVAMCLFIVIVYYTYHAITGDGNLFIDIGSFIVGAILCQLIGINIMKRNVSVFANKLGLITFIVLGIVFVIFTFYPPFMPIFKDGNTGKYGILK